MVKTISQYALFILYTMCHCAYHKKKNKKIKTFFLLHMISSLFSIYDWCRFLTLSTCWLIIKMPDQQAVSLCQTSNYLFSKRRLKLSACTLHSKELKMCSKTTFLGNLIVVYPVCSYFAVLMHSVRFLSMRLLSTDAAFTLIGNILFKLFP